MIVFFQQRKISWFSFVDDNSIHFTAKEQKSWEIESRLISRKFNERLSKGSQL